MKLIRFIAQQKLTQYCKATVLQKKKRKKERKGWEDFIYPSPWGLEHGLHSRVHEEWLQEHADGFQGSLEALGKLLVMLCCRRQIDDLLWSSG